MSWEVLCQQVTWRLAKQSSLRGVIEARLCLSCYSSVPLFLLTLVQYRGGVQHNLKFQDFPNIQSELSADSVLGSNLHVQIWEIQIQGVSLSHLLSSSLYSYFIPIPLNRCSLFFPTLAHLLVGILRLGGMTSHD